LRLWPGGSAWIEPGTFTCPVDQRWLASATQMSNEPTVVDGGESPAREKIYYHWGLDFGGAEGMIDVLSATDGVVISAGGKPETAEPDAPGSTTYDAVCVRDERGWNHGYFHLKRVLVEPGQSVRQGERIGVLGKEGQSGGWSHLHYVIKCLQPSGLWGSEDAYAYAWEAYARQYAPTLLAVARPHRLAAVGQTVQLDALKSHSFTGGHLTFRWTFMDGSTAEGPVVERVYGAVGTYSEIVEVTDGSGARAVDFATVQILEGPDATKAPPSVHAVYAPTFGIRPDLPVTFKTRSFCVTEGREVWDFGDGSAPVSVQSGDNANQMAEDGYACVEHAYAAPGLYLARVERVASDGRIEATARLAVHVEPS
jgi:hypothetical protein